MNRCRVAIIEVLFSTNRAAALIVRNTFFEATHALKELFSTILYLSQNLQPMKNYLPFLVIVLFCKISAAQDLHHSLFHLVPSFYNAAATSVSEDPWRAGAMYRQQWSAVPVPYMTATGVFDKKWGGREEAGGWASSFLFHYDRAGDTKLNWMELGINVAYGIKLSSKNVVSLGFQASGIQRAFSNSGLTFDKQFVDDFFNSSNPTGENLSNKSKLGIDLGTGIYMLHRFSKQLSVTLGAAARHLNQPDIHFFDEQNKALPLRFNYQSSVLLGTSKSSELQFNALYSTQEVQRELIAGGLFRYFLNGDERAGDAIGLGVHWRQQDAFAPFVELRYGSWLASVSYDVNTSAFNTATNRRGGPEVAVFYTPKPVIKLKAFKPCPVF